MIYTVDLETSRNFQANTRQNGIFPQLEHPAVQLRDFISHYTEWNYNTPAAADIQCLLEWASNNDLTLAYDVMHRGTIHSARWLREYS